MFFVVHAQALVSVFLIEEACAWTAKNIRSCNIYIYISTKRNEYQLVILALATSLSADRLVVGVQKAICSPKYIT